MHDRHHRRAFTVLVLCVLFLGGCAATSVSGSSASGGVADGSSTGGVAPSQSGSLPSASASHSSASDSATPSTTFDRSAHSTTDPASIWIVVNKQRPLSPQDWAPTDLTNITLRGTTGQMRAEAATALTTLAAGSDAATGKAMTITSAYRSYAKQLATYNSWKAQYGQAETDKASARAGYSEHQTGLAVDIDESGSTCGLDACFANTATGRWVAGNAWKYGFVVRYPDGQVGTTGYVYEPWHVRYVGVALSTYMHDQGILTLEAAFGLPAAPSY